MRPTLLPLRTLLALACFALLLASTPRALQAAVCHDASWDSGEFCGRDAWLVASQPEMNHDCEIDFLDIRHFVDDFQLFGSNLSGDFDGNGHVSLGDAGTLLGSLGNSVSTCTRSGMRPDQCQGTIALSHSGTPSTIVSTLSRAPGTGTLYVIIDGWASADTIEYGVETSSNINITAHDASYTYDSFSANGWCNPDSQHSYRVFAGGTSWTGGPIAFATVDYTLLDANPAWIELVALTSCYSKARVRWAQAAADRSFDFRTVLNAGINGPAPSGQSTCGPLSLPVLAPHMIWLLVALLLAPAALLLGRRALRRAPPAA